MALKETLPKGSKLLTWLDNSDFEQPKQQQHQQPMVSPVIPPFMYTIMVSLIWECKKQQALFEKQNAVIAHFTAIFHREKFEKTKIAINAQIIIYNNQLRKIYETLRMKKIQLHSAQTVLKQIPIAIHKDLLVKAAKYYCMMRKNNPQDEWFKSIHIQISQEIKYVNHYEFHVMEEYKL